MPGSLSLRFALLDCIKQINHLVSFMSDEQDLSLIRTKRIRLLWTYRYDLVTVYNDEEKYFAISGINGQFPMQFLNPDRRIRDRDNNSYLSSLEFCYGYLWRRRGPLVVMMIIRA
ncbi:hypothetical protein LguiB_009438 [Lonicera macranthoides]